MCAHGEQRPGASQQNVANCFSLLLGKPISLRRVIDLSKETKTVSIYRQ
jgi:hypothetical protein